MWMASGSTDTPRSATLTPQQSLDNLSSVGTECGHTSSEATPPAPPSTPLPTPVPGIIKAEQSGDVSYHITINRPDQLQQLRQWRWENHIPICPQAHTLCAKWIWSSSMAQASLCWPTSTRLSTRLSATQPSFSAQPSSLTMLSWILSFLSIMPSTHSLVPLRTIPVEQRFCIVSKMTTIT